MKPIAKKIIISRLNSRVRKLLATHDIHIVAVTGSIGKTSAKHAIGETLKASYKVLYSQDSYNTDIGIPLSLFGKQVPAKLWDGLAWRKLLREIDQDIVNYQYDVVVLELADDELAMMKRVLRIVKPEITVVSAIAPVHMLHLKDMKTVVHNNWQIASQGKTIMYNADSAELRRKAYKSGTVGFGLHHGDVRITKISRNSSGALKAQLKIGSHTKMIQTHMLGEQNLYALLAAAAVANKLDIPFAAICFELSTLKPVAGRMNLLPGLNGSKLIDDSYNSSPDALRAALDTLQAFKARKIAIIGNMNELGADSAKMHQEIGEYAAKRVDMLVTIGEYAKKFTASAAERAGMKQDTIKVFRTPYEAGHYVKTILKKGDTVLIKGSQDKVFSEEAVRILLDPSVEPKAVLVRQSKVWKRRKKKSFST